MAIENDENPILFLPRVAAQGCGCVTIIILAALAALAGITYAAIY
jgi:hypothetical protein